jgi:hypothetical protein
MKKYVAIGHFDDTDNVTCVAESTTNMKSFRTDLMGNGFAAYVIITEKKLETLRDLDAYDLFEAVKKMTSNYRKWDVVTDYIYQCFDIIDDRLARA